MCNLSSATFINSSGLQLSWCLGIFPSILKCAFFFSYSYSSSQYENHRTGVFLSKALSHTHAANWQQWCFTSVCSKFSGFFISKQTVSQIDTDSDNAINQIFLQKCPNLMVFNDTHTLSAVPSLAYSVQLNAHPTCQPQPSRTAGTALTPASWTSRQSKNDTCKDSWDFYFPSFYYKLLWNILLGKTLMNRRWCGLKRRPTCSSNTPGSTISTHTPQTPPCTQDVKMGKCRAKRTMSHVFWDLVPK